METEKKTRKMRSVDERKQANNQRIKYHQDCIAKLEEKKLEIEKVIIGHEETIKALNDKNKKLDNPVKAPRKKRVSAKTKFSLEDIAKTFGCSIEEAKQKMMALENSSQEQ